jgi:hypothetical protein
MAMRTIVLIAVALMAVIALFATPVAAAKKTDEKECEVCIKVLDDIGALMTKKEAKKQPKIEEAVGKHCSVDGDIYDTLGPKEKKMCYILDPIRRSVSQPFSLGLPKKKVCERLKKDNPDICSLRFPVKMDANVDLTKLRVKQLKAIINERGATCSGCLEKQDFINKIKELQKKEL